MRKLPPFPAIRAFEAAARHGSFKSAAAELSVTPTAISHQIRQLEDACGNRLFTRRTRRVDLTREGRRFAAAVSPALDSLADAYARLCSNPSRVQVNLGAAPLISARWLLPRLPGFWAKHPEIDLWLHHSPFPVWQQIHQYDMAIAWGDGQWPGVEAKPLLNVEVTPVYAPSMNARIDSITPGDLLKFPLLHHRDIQGWTQWFESAGVETRETLTGTVFEDANLLLLAAIAGRGVALGILPLIKDDLEARKLVRPFRNSVGSADAYYLIKGQNNSMSEAVQSTWQWLAAAT